MCSTHMHGAALPLPIGQALQELQAWEPVTHNTRHWLSLTLQLLAQQSLLLLHQCCQLGLQGTHAPHQPLTARRQAGQLQPGGLCVV